MERDYKEQYNIMVQSTIEIVEQLLNGNPMLSGRLVHKLRQLANRISNVNASKRQVLKTSHHSVIFQRIEDD